MGPEFAEAALLNREAAFALWARSFIEENDLSNDNWPIIEKLDADGLTPKELFFDEVRETFGITKDVKDQIADYNIKYPACYPIDEGTVRAVRRLRSNGWKVGVVTNGSPSQRKKFEVTNIAREFDAVCISATVSSDLTGSGPTAVGDCLVEHATDYPNWWLDVCRSCWYLSSSTVCLESWNNS